MSWAPTVDTVNVENAVVPPPPNGLAPVDAVASSGVDVSTPDQAEVYA
jgi:hypothetical protein